MLACDFIKNIKNENNKYSYKINIKNISLNHEEYLSYRGFVFFY